MGAKINEFTREQFSEVFKHITVGFSLKLDEEFLYSCYQEACEAVEELYESSITENLAPVNSYVLCCYIINEYYYFLLTNPGLDINKINENEDLFAMFVSRALDKYYTNEHLAYKTTKFTNKYQPPMSTLKVYVNFVLGMLNRYQKNDPKNTLIVDMICKGFNLIDSILNLLEDGAETVAFSTWRTLHETECILIILARYGEPVVARYLKHMKYAAAFRGLLATKEETDKEFEILKSEMKELDLKSKDMKRYIEYGWLVGVPNYKDIDIKFNFRDGVQKVAGLSNYSSDYELSSEIAHSSPLMIYSNKNFFYVSTLLNVYESFFRLEKVFSDLFVKTISENEFKSYDNMRKTYFEQLIQIHEKETTRLKNMKAKSKRDL